jgi:hypothetical protein
MNLNKTKNEDDNKNEKENAKNENEFGKIFDNIIEVNLDKEIKRRNSFTGKNIFQKKLLKKIMKIQKWKIIIKIKYLLF